MDFDQFLTYFKGARTTGGNQYTACCPAHDDKHPSLSIKLSNDRDCILVHCHAGCETKDVLTKVGLKESDLYMNQTERTTSVLKERTYQYHDEDGMLVYTKTRKEYIDGHKSFFFEQPNGQKNLRNAKRVLYNLPAVLKASKVFFVEGEKCADAVIAAGYVATTLDNGAKSPWKEHYADYLKDREVVILPDNDVPGMNYAKRIMKHIPNATIVQLPNLPEKGDVYDWLQQGHTMDEIDSLPKLDLSVHISKPSDENASAPTVHSSSKKTQAEIAVDLVEQSEAVLFRDSLNDLFAAVTIDNHKEIWSIESENFSLWLSGLFYHKTGKPINNDKLKQALTILSAKARFDCKESIPLWNRIAKQDDVFWYDLSNPDWQAVKITTDGWTIEDNIPLLFKRYRHQKSQEMPSNSGDLRRILKYINISEEYQTLFLCWLVSCFVPDIPHPMPILFGEKGAAKSTTCCFLKQIIDPSRLETLTLQKSERSLAVNLQQHWLLPFDNVSKISTEISDTLCRAITGSGIQQRKLYTDADDYIFTFKRCLVLNGINNVANRPDLLDRSILMKLKRIPEEKRRELTEVQLAFEEDLPYILGGVFDVLSKAMELFPSVKLERLPRMADFARWGYAISQAMDIEGKTFLEEYTLNQFEQTIEVINCSTVATLMVNFMSDKSEWHGLVSELYKEFEAIAPALGINPKSKEFPSAPNKLSVVLNNLQSNLTVVGITFQTKRDNRGTEIAIKNEKLSTLSSYQITVPQFAEHPVSLDTVTIVDGDSDDEDEEVEF